MSDVVQTKVLLLIAGISHPLELGQIVLKKYFVHVVLVPLIVHRLRHFLGVTAFVRYVKQAIVILAGLHLCADQRVQFFGLFVLSNNAPPNIYIF